jgi:Arc/MetJ-type ribon-helix-helix transcriptional regulator
MWIMTIQLPEDLECGIRATVLSGAFASEDEAIAEAVRQFLRKQLPLRKTPMTEQDLQRQMLEIGLLTQLPDTSADFDDPDDQLVDIEGEPLSETVIRERR